MKKKNFKSLNLKKYSISNLALLHNKIGGNVETNTELATTNTTAITSSYPECTVPNASELYDCTSSERYTCNCNTNTGTSKAEAPSEHQNCNANNHLLTGDSN